MDEVEDYAQTVRLPGRPKAVWDKETAEQIIRMRGFGHQVKQISACLDISEYQLYSLYRVEMEEGNTIFLTKIGNKGYQAAMNGNTDMIKFLLERRSPHFRQASKQEVTGPEGQQPLTKIEVTLVHASEPPDDPEEAKPLKRGEDQDEKPW